MIMCVCVSDVAAERKEDLGVRKNTISSQCIDLLWKNITEATRLPEALNFC